MKIYTKTGDDGTTGILGGDRVHKTDPRIMAIGDVDELNASIGLARLHSDDPLLAKIQSWLFDVGGTLAAPGDGRWELFGHSATAIGDLEGSIDEQTATLPPLKEFILPGGSQLSASLHFARTVCRRAERSVLAVDSSNLAEVLVFLNRLSDWLFVSARTANARASVLDTPWEKTEK
jgi:cob(I)alamin adenosyltransferase